jgi:N-acyl-D-amino-acid deacylase
MTNGSENHETNRRCHLKIIGATVIDGSGEPGVIADVAIVSDKIAAIGNLEHWRADKIIEASGKVLAPGFIDVHTHDDLAVLKTPDMSFKVSQGVTTVIAGNCGLSLAPFETGRGFPPPFPIIGDESEFDYSTVADYRRTLDKKPASLNLALLAGHSSIRVSIMGDSLQREASTEEIALMQAKLRSALQDGCIGMSTGLDYPPASDCATGEIIALASILPEFENRIYATHMRDEGDQIIEAINETLTIGQKASTPVVISHHKCAGQNNYGRSAETLSMIEAARSKQAVALDVYPYIASSTTLLPKYLRDCEKILIAYSDPYPELAGRLLNEVANDWQCSQAEAADKLYPAGGIYFQMHEDDLQRILSYPPTMVGSDGLPGSGKPHPRLWGTFPRVLGRYVREKNLLTLPQAIHKMSGLSASTFGIKNRGFIRADYYADLVIFDPEVISDTATFEEPEVPAAGIEMVVVNGVPTWENGAHSGARSGIFIIP